MKVLITSVDALIDFDTDDYFEGVKEALDEFEAMHEENHVLVVSLNEEKLDLIGDDFQTYHIAYEYRQSPALIKQIEKELHADFSDIIMLGAKMADVIMAANAKILLLTAMWAEDNNPDDKIYTVGYGEELETPEHLASFFTHFLNLATPWYYKLQVSKRTKLYALTNANTFATSQDVVRMNEQFKACLKDGVGTYKYLFRRYFVISTYYIFKELKDVKYWGIYPSSGIAHNQDLEFFKEHARKLYRCKTSHPIFVKKKATAKRREIPAAKRLAVGCKDQLETIVINPWYKNKLKGATVCIIDDFTTHGTSCETARHLLEAAGVEKLIFIALGKFGKEYHKYEYTLQPLPKGLYEGLTVTQRDTESLSGTFNRAATREMLDSLGDLL